MFGIRSRLTVGLVVAGAAAGAVFGVVLTVFGKILGGALGLAIGSGVLFLALPPIGLALGFARLGRAYPQEPVSNQDRLPSAAPKIR